MLSDPQPLNDEPPVSAEPVVRETVCKTILNHSGLDDYSLNCYTGCAPLRLLLCAVHAAISSARRTVGEFHRREGECRRGAQTAVARARPGSVFISSACDGWQSIEAERRLTRRCCDLLLERGFRLHLLTKSALILRDFDLFHGNSVRVGITLTTLDERLRQLWEPGAAGVEPRCRVIEEARRAGLETSVMFGPLLPFLSDSQENIDAMLTRAGDLGVDAIWVDALNPRPRVWHAVAGLLHAEFPDLLPSYQRILFDRSCRREYLGELRTRIDRAAKRASLSDRVSACM